MGGAWAQELFAGTLGIDANAGLRDNLFLLKVRREKRRENGNLVRIQSCLAAVFRNEHLNRRTDSNRIGKRRPVETPSNGRACKSEDLPLPAT